MPTSDATAPSRLGQVPVLTILFLVLAEHFAMLPLLANNGQLPQGFVEAHTDPIHVLRQTVVVVGHVTLMVGGLQWLLPKLPRPRVVGAVLLGLHAVLLEVFVFHFVKLGGYPRRVGLEDFASDPANVLGYIAAGMTGYDRVVVAATLALLGVLYLRGLANLPLGGAWRPSVAGGGALLLLGAALGMVPATTSLVTQADSGLPSFYWHTGLQLALTGNDNDLRQVHAYLPPRLDHGPVVVEPPEHMLVVIADSLRDDHTPFGGYPRDTMPLLAAKAEDWIHFERAYSPAAGTRSSLPPLFNSAYLAEIDNDPSNAAALWATLASAGYRTALFSGSDLRWGYVDVKSALHDLDTHVSLADSIQHHDGGEDTELVEAYDAWLQGLPPGTRTVAFVYLLSTHFPYFIPDQFALYEPNLHTVEGAFDLESYTMSVDPATLRNTYDNGIRAVDHHVTRLLDALERRGALDRSVVMITSDHGEAFGEHGYLSHGQTLHEEQIHVPLLVRVGADLPELDARHRAASDRLVGLVDLAPSLVAMAGRRPPAGFEGLSWLGPNEKPYEVIACRHLRDKLGVVTRQHKYFYDSTSRQGYAYDLRSDPAELDNLWSSPPGDLQDFLAELARRGVITRRPTE